MTLKIDRSQEKSINDFAFFKIDNTGRTVCVFTFRHKVNIFYFLYAEGFRYNLQKNFFYIQTNEKEKVIPINMVDSFISHIEKFKSEKGKLLIESIYGKTPIKFSELMKYILNDEFNNDFERSVNYRLAIAEKNIELLELEKKALQSEIDFLKKIHTDYEQNPQRKAY